MAFALLLLANACTSGPAGSGSETGGSSGSGGMTSSGGKGTGGSSANGGTTSGGADGSGGATDSGGTRATGGSMQSGGTTGSGGLSASGGRTGTGGATQSGGATGSGGLSASGGRTGTGGATGNDGGVPSNGGNMAAGGSGATGGATGAGGTTGAGGSTHAGKWQIMPLGDSITGTTCYPKLLSKELIDKGHGNFTFVGTVLNNQSCGSGVANVQTEGHGGYLVTYLTTDSPPASGKGTLGELKTWAAEKPDVVLMAYGTNDVWSSISPANITSAYSFVVDQFRGQNPSVIFFVAQITPMNPAGCSDCETRVEALNAQIPAWANGKTTAASPIYVVNVWSALPAATYTPNSTNTSDGVHPNAAGSQLMADVWYPGIVAQGIP